MQRQLAWGRYTGSSFDGRTTLVIFFVVGSLHQVPTNLQKDLDRAKARLGHGIVDSDAMAPT
jgi:hypothetical protein